MTTPAQINRYLRGQGSPLAGLGGVFVREARKNKLDPLFLVAISGAESSFGKNVKQGTYNPFGWGPHIPFKSWGDSIATVARGLRTGYFNEGLKTIAQIGSKWAPIGAGNDPTNLNSNWPKNVGKFYTELGGTGLTSGGGGDATTGALAPTPPPGVLPPAGPDLAGLALGNLATVGTREFDPVRQLSDLTMGVAAANAQPRALATLPLAEPPVTSPQAPAAATPTTTIPAGKVDPRLLKLTKRYRLPIVSGFRTPEQNAAVGGAKNSWHMSGRAVDVATGPALKRLAAYVRRHPGQFEEFFYDPLSWYVKHGRIVKGSIGGHSDHAHIVLR